MSSRLDRLFVLIETGTSPVTRKAASQQLGEVVKYHPQELQHLLNRIFQLVSNTSWDTRIAASQAVEAICQNTPQWTPPDHVQSVERPSSLKNLVFDDFDIHSVIMNSAPLMASDNLEYLLQTDVEDKELVRKQVDMINKQLNMGVCAENIVSDSDISSSLESSSREIKNKKMVSEVLNLDEVLSSREMNRVKRKAKQMSMKMQYDESGNNSSTSNELQATELEETDCKRIKIEENAEVPESNINHTDEELDWPFELFASRLKRNLFDPKWERRHGAACALREIVKVHGRSAGYSAGVSRDKLELNHQLWLEDLSLHLLCVLALDRFGDFISDQVVAPVRETCAQCLGIVVNFMDKDRISRVVNLLMCLLKEKEWEIRHGALLGIKYSLAVREDLQDSILTEVFPLILNCFGDPIDDVSAEAASALNPVCSKIINLMPQSIPALIEQLWKLLSSQDELGVACNSFMTLLASIFMNSEAQASVNSDMIINIVPYLWMYLYHNASSVRKSALQTIRSMTYSKLCIERWNVKLLMGTMRHLYQRVLVEPTNDVRLLAEDAWCNIVKNAESSSLKSISDQLFGLWIVLAMQSHKIAFDDSVFLFENKNQSSSTELSKAESTELKLYLGGNETIVPEIRESNVVYIRCMTCRLLGVLLDRVVQPVLHNLTPAGESNDADPYFNLLLSHLNSKSALQRTISAFVITEWARLRTTNIDSIPTCLKDRLRACLLESIYFDEIALSYTKVLQDTKDYILSLKENKAIVDESLANKVLRLNEIEVLTSEKSFNEAVAKLKIDPKRLKELRERRQSIYFNVCNIAADQTALAIRTQAIIAGAALTLKGLPDRLNPVIKPLMDSIKKEESEYLQKLAATHLAQLVDECCDREPCPNPKIVQNLCTLLCSDADYTPKLPSQSGGAGESSETSERPHDKFNGILTLIKQEKLSEKISSLRRMNSSGGATKANNRSSVSEHSEDASPSQNQKASNPQRRGASQALIKITELLGNKLRTKLITLWDYLYTSIKEVEISFEKDDQDQEAEKLINSLQVFEVLCPFVHKDLLPYITGVLDTLCLILNHPYCAVRHMAARCIAVLAKRDLVSVVRKLPKSILPFVNAADSITKRQGGLETIAALVDTLKLEIIPYIVVLVIPLLGRMSDQNEHVRSMASQTFSMLIQLMPLEAAGPSPPEVLAELSDTVEEQRMFLNQLLNPKCIPDFKLSISINASLRSYQQCGVNWLAFLNKYQLHGILCDDMGLGKTLQSLCIIAEDHYQRDTRYKADKRVDSVPLPSLVVCPPTLIGHWVYEIKKFIPSEYLKPLQYEGVPAERERLRNVVQEYTLIVASYDIVRKDVDFFSTIKWNYCILDEGHIIKNDKTKIAKAIKKLIANHRLILSGTPIQNNVLELWSLFDFLMPGYLGNEKQFCSKFSKPILASRDPKSSLKEQEAGIIAMETLHQKVLPFILRRMKVDVLNDLPPKITQDYYCALSPIQQMLYEDFSKSEIQKNTLTAIKSTKSCNTFSIFQALRYLQSVCNHPKLVVTPQHPLYTDITSQLEAEKSSLSDIKHAAKLMALKQLLIDCGIGGSSESDDVTKSNCIVSQHRALIFCQLKAMLNILETDLFKVHLPSVTYLRLDGSVSLSERHKIVTLFNEDPSIDVLLLTTQIGGLGLNLTGADTVIFVEHDWSPMKDLQAMDRAHRIGQKKVVNVYRLITRATLEQKIMGLQEFKLKTANTIISAENSSLMTMNTEKLLDLFALDSDYSKRGENNGSSETPANSAAEFMKSLPELWDTKDYDEEYDISTFISSLKS